MSDLPSERPEVSAGVGVVGRVVVTLLAAVAAATLARLWDGRLMAHGVAWLSIGLVVLPVAFTVALSVVAVVLVALLSLLALPHALRGRPTGLRALFAELLRLAAHVVPGYWRALRRVRAPRLWCALLGYVLGVFYHAMRFGLAPAA